MNLIVFDLELNRYNAENIFDYHGAKQSLRGEIIQIGAVKIDEQGMVLDTFKANLRPQIYRRLSPFVAKVTGFTQKQMDAGMPMQETLSQFVCWCGADATLLEWGMDDVPVLRQNLFLYAQDEQWPYCHYDLQQIFTRQYPLGEGDKLNLESVITRLALPVEREYHDALSDALYTADICRCLDLVKGIAEYPDEATQLRLSMCSVPQTEYR
ncbi:MAG: 3'-5' exonuclease, partial [Pygmaiobacter sp.]